MVPSVIRSNQRPTPVQPEQYLGVLWQPSSQLGVLVGAVVVHHDVSLEFLRHTIVRTAQEGEKLLWPCRVFIRRRLYRHGLARVVWKNLTLYLD